MLKIFRLILAASALSLSMSGFAVAAPVLIGTGTLNTAGDLTVVQEGATTFEFLDLTPTYGQTVADAVSAYSSAGFRWANGAEVATLFAAFNITYGINAGDVYLLDAALGDTASLASYLGPALEGRYALGWIDDLFSDPFTTYACISTCGGDSFVNNSTDVLQPNSIVGTFLVRDGGDNVVSEPGTLALLSLTLVGLVAARKRKAA